MFVNRASEKRSRRVSYEYVLRNEGVYRIVRDPTPCLRDVRLLSISDDTDGDNTVICFNSRLDKLYTRPRWNLEQYWYERTDETINLEIV